MTFENLGLNAQLLNALARVGYTQPTPIQEQAIPAVLEGNDILAAAQTGTGKTAAFTLPILEDLHRDMPQKGPPVVLILTPTRELAAQVGESITAYAAGSAITCQVIFGGVSARPQIEKLKRQPEIIVATPGRLLDLAGSGDISLKDIDTFVLDEADRMLDMGFIHDIKRVIKLLPTDRQNLMFSATFSPEIRELANRIVKQPVEIDVSPRNSAAKTIAQRMIFVSKAQKRELLSWLIDKNNWEQVLVFTRTKHGANRLAEQLEKDGLSAAAIHGNKSQNARTRALNGFKARELRVLVATDIAARGIDIDQLPHVINYELPMVAEDYVHRIGRTGRAGSEGEALSLVCNEETKQFKAINKLLGKPIPEWKLTEYHIKEDNGPSEPPPKQPRGGRGGNGRPNAGKPDQRRRRPQGNKQGGRGRANASQRRPAS